MGMNYIIRGMQSLKWGFIIGVLIYLIVVLLLYVLKIRRNITWKCIFEIAFCVYVITLLKITGVFTFSYSLSGIISYNIVPFVGSSIVPVILNFLLFVPYGLLLPLVFRSHKWNWKKIVVICAFTSFAIELLQVFGGRYAEIDDFLCNTFGAFTGYIIYSGMYELKKNRKKAVISFVSLGLALVICFGGIYCIGDNKKQLPDGLNAVRSNIAEVNVYFNGEKRKIEVGSETYNCFEMQISNCGGHILEPEDISENVIWNDDCFIEIIYVSAQNIGFENADDFSMENTDRILYNADKNILYWGNSSYQSYLDYAKMGEELQAHKEEILEQYEQLPALITGCFEQQ